LPSYGRKFVQPRYSQDFSLNIAFFSPKATFHSVEGLPLSLTKRDLLRVHLVLFLSCTSAQRLGPSPFHMRVGAFFSFHAGPGRSRFISVCPNHNARERERALSGFAPYGRRKPMISLLCSSFLDFFLSSLNTPCGLFVPFPETAVLPIRCLFLPLLKARVAPAIGSFSFGLFCFPQRCGPVNLHRFLRRCYFSARDEWRTDSSCILCLRLPA